MTNKPDIVLHEGRPAAVILDIADYEAQLERAEDTYDLTRLRAMRKRPLKSKSLQTYLSERKRRVHSSP